MKLNLLFLSFLVAPIILLSQKDRQTKLVVGIVVDQMRYDYLERFYDDFGENGFKRLLHEGTNFTNCRINYIPTVTGAGHASVYTGTTPYYHGIIANDWKDRKTLKDINCVSSINSPEHSLPEGISKARSPEQLISTTIGDQLKLSNNGNSKVISVSLKDRGAILPAGQSADGVFWYNNNNGKFISSYYYGNELPVWVKNFNNSGLVESYLKKDWVLFKDTEIYSNLPADDSKYEKDVFNEGRTSFPHSFNNTAEEKLFDKLVRTPYGDQILIDFVKEALQHEQLGKGKYTDMLTVSFSSPDKIGHDYGPQSYEVKDTYLRLDAQLAELLKAFDAQIGKDSYLLFLTADHGVMENPRHLRDLRIESGHLDNKKLFDGIDSLLLDQFGSKNLIKTWFTRNIYLNTEEIQALKIERSDVEKKIKEFMIADFPNIDEVYTRSELELMTPSRKGNNYLLNGFNKKRSGDIIYSLKSNSLHSDRQYGATHGSGHAYDNHIPLIFYGAGIRPSKNNSKVYITDIAETVTDLIGVTKPSNSIGKVIINP